LLKIQQSDRIVLALVGTEKENLSPLANLGLDFKDRQTLKTLEDSVTSLQVILSTMLTTISRIHDACKRCCERHCSKEEKCDCDIIAEEFDEHIKEIEMHNKRAEVLGESAKRTTQLVRRSIIMWFLS
jgi:hypothetical protein